MRTPILTVLLAGLIAGGTFASASAQVVAPASPMAGAGTNMAIAHHDRAVARRAARNGNYRKAARASHAANAATNAAAVAPR